MVIGSGALGSSVAFHLAKAGLAPVALVDKHEIASQTSPRAAGLTAQIRQSELMTRLATMAVEKIKNFTVETGEPLLYCQSGSLKIAGSRLAAPSAERTMSPRGIFCPPTSMSSPAIRLVHCTGGS